MGQDGGSSPCAAVVGDHLREKLLLARRQGPCLQLTRVTDLALLVWGGPILSQWWTMVCGAGSVMAGLLLGCELLGHLGVWPSVPLGTSPQCSVLGTGQQGCAGIMVTSFLSYSCLFLSHLSVCPSVRLSVSLQAFL